MTELPDIGPAETFGRGIFDGSRAKDAAKGKVHPKVFREKSGNELSVDRLSFGSFSEIAATHDGERPNQSLHGWAVVNHSDACLMGRTAVASPIPMKNKWHADIVLPPFSDDEMADRKAHSVNLANHAVWQPTT